MIEILSVAFFSLVLLSSLTWAQPYVAYLDNVDAEAIVNGDTPLIEIRMYGVDAPEKAQLCVGCSGACYKFGQRSSWYLSGLLTDEAKF